MKLAIAGCTGRMGQALIKAALADKHVMLAAGSERPDFDEAGARKTLAALGCPELFLTADPAELAKSADAVIDFTAPEATLAVAAAVAGAGGIHIVGTTGLTDKHMEALKRHAGKARIVQSGNFSLGVNVMLALAERAAARLDGSYDIEISEFHHKHKKDAPSGTALMLGRAAAQGRNVDFERKKKLDRRGERETGDIGFSVSRGGDVVGEHSVFFAGPGEVLELTHKGFSRDIYAQGALHAARWAMNQKPGLYAMRDVLGF